MDNAKNHLKPDITFAILGKVSLSQSDDQAAEQLQKTLNFYETRLKKRLRYRDLFPLFQSYLFCIPLTYEININR
jgi:hypothetical protein